MMQLFIRLSMFLNWVCAGDPRETLCLRAAVSALVDGNRFAIAFCKVIDFFDRDHCLKVFLRAHPVINPRNVYLRPLLGHLYWRQLLDRVRGR